MLSKTELRLQEKEAQFRKDLKSQIKVKVVENISYCTDYGEDTFKKLPINRDLNRNNVRDLIDAFIKVHPCGVSVLVVIRTAAFSEDGVTKKDYLCDGHHRRQAALELSAMQGSPVPLSFVIVEIDGKDTIENVGKVLETINVNLAPWKNIDHVKHISELGLSMSDDYKLYTEYCGKHPNIAPSYMLKILSLGKVNPKQFKEKAFKIANRKKSDAILNVFTKIGFNDKNKDDFSGFPETNIKRKLITTLIGMEIADIKESTAKFKNFLKENQFDYNETRFQEQIDEILSEEEEEEETTEEAEAEEVV